MSSPNVSDANLSLEMSPGKGDLSYESGSGKKANVSANLSADLSFGSLSPGVNEKRTSERLSSLSPSGKDANISSLTSPNISRRSVSPSAVSPALPSPKANPTPRDSAKAIGRTTGIRIEDMAGLNVVLELLDAAGEVTAETSDNEYADATDEVVDTPSRVTAVGTPGRSVSTPQNARDIGSPAVSLSGTPRQTTTLPTPFSPSPSPPAPSPYKAAQFASPAPKTPTKVAATPTRTATPTQTAPSPMRTQNTPVASSSPVVPTATASSQTPTKSSPARDASPVKRSPSPKAVSFNDVLTEIEASPRQDSINASEDTEDADPVDDEEQQETLDAAAVQTESPRRTSLIPGAPKRESSPGATSPNRAADDAARRLSLLPRPVLKTEAKDEAPSVPMPAPNVVASKARSIAPKKAPVARAAKPAGGKGPAAKAAPAADAKRKPKKIADKTAPVAPEVPAVVAPVQAVVSTPIAEDPAAVPADTVDPEAMFAAPSGGDFGGQLSFAELVKTTDQENGASCQGLAVNVATPGMPATEQADTRRQSAIPRAPGTARPATAKGAQAKRTVPVRPPTAPTGSKRETMIPSVGPKATDNSSNALDLSTASEGGDSEARRAAKARQEAAMRRLSTIPKPRTVATKVPEAPAAAAPAPKVPARPAPSAPAVAPVPVPKRAVPVPEVPKPLAKTAATRPAKKPLGDAGQTPAVTEEPIKEEAPEFVDGASAAAKFEADAAAGSDAKAARLSLAPHVKMDPQKLARLRAMEYRQRQEAHGKTAKA